MIIRVVKLTFQPEKVSAFLKVFNAKKELIRDFPGCEHLELLRDVNAPNVYFTYSYWLSEVELNNYRYSELFKETWADTKILFSGKPEAWSLNREVALT